MTEQVDIYIGAEIEYESERKAIHHIVELVRNMNTPAIIIANAHIKNVQTDLIVAFERASFVIEIKGSRLPLKGALNGQWLQKSNTNAWVPIRNYYDQTLKAKNNIKNALCEIKHSKDFAYPTGILLFVPGLHEESSVPTSDFKVQIEQLSTFNGFNNNPHEKGATLSDWHILIKSLNLRQTSLNAIINEKNKEAAKLVEDYLSYFTSTYQRDVSNFVPIDCIVNKEKISSQEITNIIISKSNILVVGDSGFGKTLLAKEIGVSICTKGYVPIFIEAKYFEDLLNPLLDNEVKLLGSPSAAQLFNAANILDKEVIIILDGLNECTPILQKRLCRWLRVTSDRYSLKLIVVSQTREDILEPLGVTEIKISPPSQEVKLQIAAKYATSSSLPALKPILLAAHNGLEARLIGELGNQNLYNISKFALFDLFVRTRVGDDVAPIAVKALSLIAGSLSERIAFSLSTREIDRIFDNHSIPSGIKYILIKNNILKSHLDRISFGHELFLNTYAAEFTIRSTNGNTNQITAVLKMPRHFDKAALILGAIEDITTLNELLPHITDKKLIIKLLNGESGSFCREWANDKFLKIIDKLKLEASNLHFEIVDLEVKIKEESLCKWTNQEMGFISAFPFVLSMNSYLELFLEVLRSADKNIDDAERELQSEAKEKKIPLRNDLFVTTYILLPHSYCGISQIVSALGSGVLSFNVNSNESFDFKDISQIRDWTNGQLYSILSICRFREEITCFFDIICDFLKNRWLNLPYHLRHLLIDVTRRFWTEESEKKELIILLFSLDEGNLLLSSSITDALSYLGAFDNDIVDHERVVQFEINELLLNQNKSNSYQSAYNLYQYQFDSPYSNAYVKAISSLNEASLKSFLLMAIQGVSSYLFLQPLLIDIANLKDPSVGPHLMKWLNAPNLEKGFVQDEFNAYILTHIIFAGLELPIVSSLNRYDSNKKNTLCACAEICYWINRNDLDVQTREKKCALAWEYLEIKRLDFSLDALAQTSNTIRNSDLPLNLPIQVQKIEHFFPKQVAVVARRTLNSVESIKTIYGWANPNRVVLKALDYLGEYGEVVDIPLLKSFVDDAQTSDNAMNAIKKLEQAI